MMTRKRVLILCTGNSARSQMAEALLRHDAGDRFEVFSAGVEPAAAVRTEAITVMQEVSIDLRGHRPKHVNTFSGQTFDYVLTVCDHARETCPVFPASTKAIHRAFRDPALCTGSSEECVAAFRQVRDEIRVYLKDFPNR